MTRIVRITADQQVTLDDFQNLAQDPRDLADLLARTSIEGGRAYFGAEVVRVSTSRVQIETPLGLYDGGAIYSRDAGETVEIDLLSELPTTGNRKIIAIVMQGTEQTDETQERDYKTGVVNNVIQTEARPTDTRIFRRANISTVKGAQAPQPGRPVVDSALIVIAWVTLSSTGIIANGIEQNTDDRLNTLRMVDGRLELVEDWRATAEPAIDGLKTDVSKLLSSANQKVDRSFQGYMLEQLARLNEAVGVSPDASYSFTDYFLDREDTAEADTVANVEEGIRFAADNQDTRPLELLTPGDTSIQISSGGLVLPKYSKKTVLSVKGRDAEVALSNAGSQTINYELKTVSKQRTRYGNSFLVCTNAQWWQTGRYDSVAGIFYRDGVAYNVDFAEQHPSGNPNHSIKRLRQIFVDTYEEPYWAATVEQASYTGQVGGNTFMMPRSGWVVAFRYGFSRIDAGGGDIRAALCEVNDSGSPKYDSVLADVTIAHEDLKVWPEMTEVDIEPTYCEGGKHYGWFLITPGNHWLAMVEGNAYAQGTFFLSTDGVWSQGNIAQDACFEVVVAEFETSRLVVNLINWNLSGGITDIDLLTKQVSKDRSFDIVFEVQVGSDWVPLTAVTGGNNPLYGLPAALNARMVFVGTTQLMPGIRVAESFVTVSRPRTDGTHTSKARTAPANVDEVQISARLEHYADADHDCDVTLLTGAGFATEVNPSGVSERVSPDGSTKRTWTFSGLDPTTEWKRKTEIATSSALSVFLVSEMTDVAFPAA